MRKYMKVLCCLLCGVLLSCYVLSTQPESKAEAFAPAVALLWLIPILAAGAGYALSNFNADNKEALAADCQRIFDDVTDYAMNVENGRITTDRLTRDDARAWSALENALATGDTLTTAALNTLSKVFGSWADDRYDSESSTLQIADVTKFSQDLSVLSDFVTLWPKYTTSKQSISNLIAQYNPPFVLTYGLSEYNDGVLGMTYDIMFIPTASDVSVALYAFDEGTDSGSRYKLIDASGADVDGIGIMIYTYPDGTMYSANRITTYPFWIDCIRHQMTGAVDRYVMDYINAYPTDDVLVYDSAGHYIGDTTTSDSQYQAIDRTWANDYGVNSRDDTIDSDTVISIPGTATIDDFLDALGNVVTVEDLQAIIDKAVADAIATDIPIETTDESTGETESETGAVVVPPGDIILGALSDAFVPSQDVVTDMTDELVAQFRAHFPLMDKWDMLIEDSKLDGYPWVFTYTWQGRQYEINLDFYESYREKNKKTFGVIIMFLTLLAILRHYSVHVNVTD